MQCPTGNTRRHARYKDFVAQARAENGGWTAFKFQGDGIPPRVDPQYREPRPRPLPRNLTAKDIRRIVNGMETVREELGPDIDFAIEAHWRYDVNPPQDFQRGWLTGAGVLMETATVKGAEPDSLAPPNHRPNPAPTQ